MANKLEDKFLTADDVKQIANKETEESNTMIKSLQGLLAEKFSEQELFIAAQVMMTIDDAIPKVNKAKREFKTWFDPKEFKYHLMVFLAGKAKEYEKIQNQEDKSDS